MRLVGACIVLTFKSTVVVHLNINWVTFQFKRILNRCHSSMEVVGFGIKELCHFRISGTEPKN